MRSESPHEIDRLSRYYGDYHAKSVWAKDTPGNRAIHDERTRALAKLAQRLPRPVEQISMLDVGCGAGALLGLFASWGTPTHQLAGVDLMEDRVAAARAQWPGIDFQTVNAEQLPFDNERFHVVSTFTVFSSLLDRGLARRVAEEVGRVLKPGGVVLWYDLRVNNPSNPNVRGISFATVQELFPGYVVDVRTITLAPPLARRLGPATQIAYPILAALPVLRTHYLGTLQKPLA